MPSACCVAHARLCRGSASLVRVMTQPERRTVQRHRTLKAGKIILHGASVLDCTIRNLSAAGAAIAVPNAATVPAEFELQFDGDTRHCTVAWRRMDRLGVKFK
jgi:hypothetical protein